MPEASFLCVDSTEFMRNGDYFPNRLMAVQEATNLLCNAKMQQNQENTIGFLTMGGNACNVVETLTSDVDRVVASLTQIPLGGKKAHFCRGLQIASLALTHCIQSRSEKRIITFLGSPLMEDAEELTKLAKKLRKDNYAVDIVAFGTEESTPILQDFIEKVNKDGNSHLLVIPEGSSITDCLMSSAIFLGNDAVAAAGAGGAGAPSGPVTGFEFGVDPNVDPELAMVLRMSMEEERRRQEAAAQPQPNPGAAAPVAAPASEPSTNATATAELNEEEELALALKMSEEAAAAEAGSSQSLHPEVEEALHDEDFMAQLKASLQQNPPKAEDHDDKNTKPK